MYDNEGTLQADVGAVFRWHGELVRVAGTRGVGNRSNFHSRGLVIVVVDVKRRSVIQACRKRVQLAAGIRAPLRHTALCPQLAHRGTAEPMQVR